MTPPRPPRPLAVLDRLRGDDAGTTSVSFALVFPLILLLVLLVVQGGLVWWARDVATTAASEGASVARSYRSGPAAGAGEADLVLKQYGGGLTVKPSTENVPRPGEVQVTVRVRAQSVIPGLAGTWITSAVTSPKEAWLP